MEHFCFKTSIGDISILADERGVTNVCFGKCFSDYPENRETKIIQEAFFQLEEYLLGKRKKFDIKINHSGTAFQTAVWKEIAKIPYGKVKTYSELAKSIDNPKASRAIGMACNRNPVPIFMPCHRVVGSNGGLVGYSAGIHIKKKLLEIEGSFS